MSVIYSSATNPPLLHGNLNSCPPRETLPIPTYINVPGVVLVFHIARSYHRMHSPLLTDALLPRGRLVSNTKLTMTSQQHLVRWWLDSTSPIPSSLKAMYSISWATHLWSPIPWLPLILMHTVGVKLLDLFDPWSKQYGQLNVTPSNELRSPSVLLTLAGQVILVMLS